MKNKVLLIGKMGTGKTAIANMLCERYEFQRYSFAAKLKEIAIDLFDMKEKDRDLLQKLGMRMRDIDSGVWYKYLYRKINKLEDNTELPLKFVIDDCRFINELNYFKERGWTPIKLSTIERKRITRITNLYEAPTEKQLNDPSETEIDDMMLPFVFETDEMTLEDKFEKVLELLKWG